MGIEFRESSLVLNNKTTVVAKKGMTFNINVGITKLNNKGASDERGKKYALFIGDTVVVNEVRLTMKDYLPVLKIPTTI